MGVFTFTTETHFLVDQSTNYYSQNYNTSRIKEQYKSYFSILDPLSNMASENSSKSNLKAHDTVLDPDLQKGEELEMTKSEVKSLENEINEAKTNHLEEEDIDPTLYQD